MPQVRAATVSNKLAPRKRKRNHEAVDIGSFDPSPNTLAELPPPTSAQTVTVPTKTEDGPSNSKPAKPKKRKLKVAADGNESSSSTAVEPSVPWPPHFEQLEKTHRALNLVYTFFCTRKPLATTLDNLKSTVESHIKRELSIEETAQIAYLLPKSVRFGYVDERALDPDNGTSTKDPKDVFALRESDSTDYNMTQVLVFEFVDLDLKRQVQDPKTGEPTRPRQRLRNDKLKMPVYGQKQMVKTIEKRNEKFKNVVNSFLNRCQTEGIDPVEKLLSEFSTFVPSPLSSRAVTPAPDRAKLPLCIPRDRKSIPEIIEEIKSLEWYTGQIVPDGHREFPAQNPVFGHLKFALSQNLVNALFNTKNIDQFYSHQAEAINSLYDGYHVIVSTSTSSGKSLIYQLPVVHELEKDINTRAMYIFPTKALAQDQKRSLKDLLRLIPGLEEAIVETFDGDTPMEERNDIRDQSRVIFTNPDMLHITILPQEEAWRTFLKNLKFVVVDELHVYNGLFGTHVALIMRRLRRICASVGNRHIKFISCSATVANPEEHMKTIFGVDHVKLTDVDGSPSGRKEFLCWNTPYKEPGDPTSGRGNSLQESARLFCQLILRGVRVIAFCRIRTMCEILMKEIQKELTNLERHEVVNRVMSYRGGYTPQDRRRIEKEMFDGHLVGIIATTALELGIDIGSLDAVITVGFPYTIANLRQQSGRAGRRNKDSLSILVGDSFPTDQYYMANPDELFNKPNCALQVDLSNLLVLEGHAQCAAHEMPLDLTTDTAWFGPLLDPLARERMRCDKHGFFHCSERFLPRPARFVEIRDTEDEHFAIVDTTHGRNVVLEEIEASRAFFTIYEGGIFLHQGKSFLVQHFDPKNMLARVVRVDVPWTTQQRDFTDIDPIETELIRALPVCGPDGASLASTPVKAYYGRIRIKQVVYGYFKIDSRGRVLDAVEVDNPPIELFSKGFWLDVPKSAIDLLSERGLNVAGAIHAAEHAVLSLMPAFVISMPGDVKTECKIAKKEFMARESKRKRPARLTFYDAKGGGAAAKRSGLGAGICTKAFEFVDDLLQKAVRRLAACECLEGCLECCCSEACRDANLVMCKKGGEAVLRSLLGWEIDVEGLPWGEELMNEGGRKAPFETIVVAEEVALVGASDQRR